MQCGSLACLVVLWIAKLLVGDVLSASDLILVFSNYTFAELLTRRFACCATSQRRCSNSVAASLGCRSRCSCAHSKTKRANTRRVALLSLVLILLNANARSMSSWLGVGRMRLQLSLVLLLFYRSRVPLRSRFMFRSRLLSVIDFADVTFLP